MIKEIFLTCALALAPVGGWRPPLGHADHAFFSMLREMTDYDLHFLHEPFTWRTLSLFVMDRPPGSIFLIDGGYSKLVRFFKGRDFEWFPFTWRTYYIVRKRGKSSA